MRGNVFKMGDIVMDLESKDIMKVTNGVQFPDGEFIPTEAICLRVTGWAQKPGSKKTKFQPVIGYTYRKFPINSQSLSKLDLCGLFDPYFGESMDTRLDGGRF